MDVFDTHFRGTAEVARHAMPHLIQSGSGRLINISSSAMLGSPTVSAYSAAKGAIWGLTNSLQLEAAQYGVQITTVQPSAWTPMTEAHFDNPAVQKVLREKLPSVAVSAFVTWLAHQDTTVSGETFQTSGVSAGRTAFGAMPRVRIEQSTPEAWAANAESLMNDAELNPLRSMSESFRAEMVFLESAVADELPVDATDVTIR